MAFFFHSVSNFGLPFLLVDETTFVIPKGADNSVPISHFKFLFILNGEVEHEMDGLEGRRALKSGDILISPDSPRHVYFNLSRSKTAQLHLVRLFLDADYLRKIGKQRVKKPELDFPYYVLHHFPKAFQITGGIDSEISELLNKLRKETELKQSGYRHRVLSICMDLVVLIARKISSPGQIGDKTDTSARGAMIGIVKEYIHKHLAQDITLGEIAWHVGKGEEHLARVFKRSTGQSVFDYVRESRINNAKTLLSDPSLSLTQIAQKCGFQSLSFFSRTFRQHVGMSPSVYRQSLR